MKKVLLLLLPVILAAIVFLAVSFYLNQASGKGALQVTANPKSNVYLNGKLLGQTPLCKCEGQDTLQSGEYTVRIVPLESGFTPFEQKIPITSNVLTVVDWTFGKGAVSDGSVITLVPIDDKKKSELLVLSFPEEASVYVDNSLQGQTPLLQKNITDSDHELRLVKTGYKDKMVRIRTVPGYKLSSTAFLGLTTELVESKPLEQTATPAATISPQAAKVIILQTPTGFLRVRASGSLSAAEIARVKPGETYDFLEETSGWYAIKLSNGETGWISSQYAQKQ